MSVAKHQIIIYVYNPNIKKYLYLNYFSNEYMLTLDKIQLRKKIYILHCLTLKKLLNIFCLHRK